MYRVCFTYFDMVSDWTRRVHILCQDCCKDTILLKVPSRFRFWDPSIRSLSRQICLIDSRSSIQERIKILNSTRQYATELHSIQLVVGSLQIRYKNAVRVMGHQISMMPLKVGNDTPVMLGLSLAN